MVRWNRTGNLVLLTDFIGAHDLGMLKILGLGVVSPLPVELLHETVSEPDVEEGNVLTVGVVDTAAEQFFAPVVSMHEGPGR